MACNNKSRRTDSRALTQKPNVLLMSGVKAARADAGIEPPRMGGRSSSKQWQRWEYHVGNGVTEPGCPNGMSGRPKWQAKSYGKQRPKTHEPWAQAASKTSASGLSSLTPASSSLTIKLDEEICCEVVENEEYFAKLGLIGRFRGIWPSLLVLHKWISETWSPVVKGEIQIYPCARGFFVVIFYNIQDRNAILCNQWVLDKSLLLLKPWHSFFNPATESFAATPVWVRLPNLPLQFWFDSCFETIGNSMGKFLYVDQGTSSFFHSTFVRILGELDIAKDLPVEITLKSTAGTWSQAVDYEGLPFKC